MDETFIEKVLQNLQKERPQDADLLVAPEAVATAQASGVIVSTANGVWRTPIYNINLAISGF